MTSSSDDTPWSATSGAGFASDAVPSGPLFDWDGGETPAAWVQWKGTNVCMDVRCACGAHGHIDAEFAYFVECGACQQVYAVQTTLALVPWNPTTGQPMEVPRATSEG